MESTPEKREANLNDRLKRFEERVEAEEGQRERNRPQRTVEQTIAAAIDVITEQRNVEQAKLDRGGYRMAAQEQAQRETVRDLEWLIDDLQKAAP